MLKNGPTEKLVLGSPTVGVPATGAVALVALAGDATVTPRPTARSAHDNILTRDLAKGMRLADITRDLSIRGVRAKVPQAKQVKNELRKPVKAHVGESSPFRGHATTRSQLAVTERHENFGS